jgi:hypothetical protein
LKQINTIQFNTTSSNEDVLSGCLISSTTGMRRRFAKCAVLNNFIGEPMRYVDERFLQRFSIFLNIH